MSQTAGETDSADYLKRKRKATKQRLRQFWTAKNDELLLKNVEDLGKDWSKIAKIFNDPLITPQRVKQR